MTATELCRACGFTLLSCGDREIAGGVYCCDLLSMVMGRAKENDAFVTVMAHIAVGLQDSAVYKIPIRILAGGVAEHIAVFIGIDKIVGIPDFSDAAGLVESVPFKAGTIGHKLSGDNA